MFTGVGAKPKLLIRGNESRKEWRIIRMNNSNNLSSQNGERVLTWLWLLLIVAAFAAVMRIHGVFNRDQLEIVWWQRISVFISLLNVLLAVGAIWIWLKRSKPVPVEKGLLYTLGEILDEQRYPIRVLVLVVFVSAGSLALLTVPFSFVFKFGEATLFIGYSIGLLSVVLAFLAMHYAFRAEKKTGQLVVERGHFIEGFTAFIRRITHELDIIYDKSQKGVLGRDEYYWIKCMYLTPSLGHAALREHSKEAYSDHELHQEVINKLRSTNKCRVSILTLNKMALVRWYAQVEWIEKARKITKSPNDDKLKELINDVRDTLMERKGKGEVLINRKYSVPGITRLCDNWLNNNDISEDVKRRLAVAVGNDLPYQLCLVTRIKMKKPEKWPLREAYKYQHPLKRAEKEKTDFAIISLVGSGTYERVIRDIELKRLPYGIGIQYLLQRLHSVIYTTDAEFCKILNHHYWNLFENFVLDKNKYSWQYPKILKIEWGRKKWYGLPTKAKK